MSKYILFSPIGGTDPIANERDGSMLHICRKYKPDCVMLYLSGEMCQRHHKDDRYCDSLRRLASYKDFSPEILIEERPELSEVQVYDFFFQEFRPLLLDLHRRFPEHQLILNIASGTPAMKNALYLLAAFLPFPVLPVQTSTPVKAQNPRLEPHVDYEVELYWTFNLDNEDYIDRCQECKYENLNVQLRKETIAAHLDAYDYAAALAVAKPIRPLLNPRAYDLLEAAKTRAELNWRSLNPDMKTELGLQGSMQSMIDISEYLLWLRMKQKRKDLADFLRGLTPGLFALMKLTVEQKAGYKLSRYCDEYDRILWEQMEEKEMGREFLEILNKNASNWTYVNSSHYAAILKNKCDSAKWTTLLLQLREIETNLRNPVAHTITQVNEQWLRRKENISSSEIMELIKKTVQAINEDHSGDPAAKLSFNWGAYDAMNEKIKAALV